MNELTLSGGYQTNILNLGDGFSKILVKLPTFGQIENSIKFMFNCRVSISFIVHWAHQFNMVLTLTYMKLDISMTQLSNWFKH